MCLEYFLSIVCLAFMLIGWIIFRVTQNVKWNLHMYYLKRWLNTWE